MRGSNKDNSLIIKLFDSILWVMMNTSQLMSLGKRVRLKFRLSCVIGNVAVSTFEN